MREKKRAKEFVTGLRETRRKKNSRRRRRQESTKTIDVFADCEKDQQEMIAAVGK